MYFIFSLITGVLIAVMIVANGELGSSLGLYSSATIIHLIGLIFVTLVYVFSKKPNRKSKGLPFYMYLGGVIGVFTIVFNNMAFGKISVSAILGLGLLGQSITSIFIDQFGLFNMPQVKFNKRKFVGLAFLLVGIFIMTSSQQSANIGAVIVSLLTGLTIVLGRTINAKLAHETNMITSTLFNFIVGFATSLVVLLIAGRGEAMFVNFALPSNWLIYTGGILGVFTIMLLNIVVRKISSFYLTLLLFVGQVFAAIFIDIFLSGAFSANNLIGGIFVAFGLSLNVIFDKMVKNEQLKAIQATS